jgi:hypothetical protein
VRQRFEVLHQRDALHMEARKVLLLLGTLLDVPPAATPQEK